MQAQSTDVTGVAQLDLLGPREIVIRGMQGQIRGVVLMDAQDFERISRYKWHIVASKGNTYARRYVGVDSRQVKQYAWMHREIVGVGDFDGTVEIDHRDGDGLNNQRSNLIVSDRKRNAQNRRKIAPATSRHRGVRRVKGRERWTANVKAHGREIVLGTFDTEEEAAESARAGRAKYLPHSQN